MFRRHLRKRSTSKSETVFFFFACSKTLRSCARHLDCRGAVSFPGTRGGSLSAERLAAQSPHSRVALPIDPGHPARSDLDFKRTKATDFAASFLFHRHRVVTGRHRNSKMAFLVRFKRGDNPLVLHHDEINVGKRRGAGNPLPDRSGTGGT